MLAAQQRRPDLIRNLLALAPAINWDQTFIRPRLAAGEDAEEARGTLADVALKDAVRILHGEQDGIAPVSEAVRLIEQLKPRCDVGIRMYQGVGHELSKLKGLPPRDLFHVCDELLELAAGTKAARA